MKTTGKTKQYDAAKKECEDRNNARNRDAFSITKANRFLQDEKCAVNQIESSRSSNVNETEDMLIELIDAKGRKDEV